MPRGCGQHENRSALVLADSRQPWRRRTSRRCRLHATGLHRPTSNSAGELLVRSPVDRGRRGRIILPPAPERKLGTRNSARNATRPQGSHPGAAVSTRIDLRASSPICIGHYGVGLRIGASHLRSVFTVRVRSASASFSSLARRRCLRRDPILACAAAPAQEARHAPRRLSTRKLGCPRRFTAIHAIHTRSAPLGRSQPPRYAATTSRWVASSAPVPVERDAAAFHHVGVVGDRERAARVLLDEQDRRAARALVGHDREDLVDELGRQAHRRLVEQQRASGRWRARGRSRASAARRPRASRPATCGACAGSESARRAPSMRAKPSAPRDARRRPAGSPRRSCRAACAGLRERARGRAGPARARAAG